MNGLNFELGAPLSQTRRIVRHPLLKRNKPDEPLNERVRLERVLGVTVGSNAAVDCSSEAGLLAYPAGGTVVLLRRGRQSHLAAPASRKAITTLRFSCDGQYLVTGESGHQPAVRVWDVQRRQLLHHFCAHKHGVTCVGFSPGNKYVVSVGFQHDMIVNVWDWQRNQKVASNKVSARVKAVSFADNGSYFVTVGNRHVKFWYLELARPSKLKEAVPLTGRSAILGEQRNNYFCDVACGRGETADSTFAITRSGLLCEFNNRRLLDKWVELRTETAYCMTACDQFIFIGCSDGLVRCFSPHTLRFITTLPRPHYLGVDVAQGLNISHMVNCPAGSRFPDCVGVCFDTVTRKLSCFYDDHSIYIWDVGDIRKVGKFASYLYHSACIWGVEMYPHHQADASGGGGGGSGANTGSSVAPLPSGSFLTCSSDDTVRVWNLEAQLGASSSNLNRNVYSSELLKVLYMDSSLQSLKGNSTTPSAVAGAGVAGTAAGGGSADKQDTAGYNCRNGVRSICVSPDGRSLASGDRRGNIRVHDLQLMEEQCMIEAHDGEVLCLQYSRPDTGLTLLASASRDRLIHLFNVAQQFEFVQTLDDHSSSITAVRFYQHQGRTCMVSCGADRSVIFREAVTSQSDTGRSQLQLHAPPPAAKAATAAAAADSAADDSQVQFVLSRHVVGKTSLYDIELDHSQRHILTACQDRNVRVYSVANGKQSRAFRGSSGDDGTLIKLALDQSGIYVVTSSTDKTLSIYDYFSGELMAVMHGHSELVTGVKFSPDCRHLVSVSGDGCVFVWRVPRDMQQTMAARLQQQWRRGRRRQTQSVAPIVPLTGVAPATDAEAGPDSDQRLSASRLPAPTFSPDPSADPGYDSTATNDRDLTDSYFRFSVGQLPRWARKDATVLVPSQLSPPEDTRAVPEPPRGRWGRRAADTAAGGGADKTIFQHDHTDSLHPFPGYGTDSLRASSIPDSEASKDSSLEEARKTSPKPSAASLAAETAVANSRNGRNQNDDSSDLGSYRPDEGTTDHDGDIDSGPESTENDTSEAAAVYFPQPLSDELSSSQYTVNAMDQDELRRSVRRYRRGRPSRLQLPQSSSSAAVITSAAASPVPDLESDLDFDLDEDDDDDDEEAVSTPSAEDGTVKRLGGLLSTSMESLSVATRQERYMVRNFSLTDSVRPERLSDVSLGVKASISSQYHERSSDTVGSASTGAATGAAITDRSELSQRRRSELQRRIQETRQQLHNIGLRGVGGMRGSHSVCDLSRVAESAAGGGGGRLRRRRDSFHQQLQLSSARVRMESGDSQSGRYPITGPSGDMSDGGLAGGGGGGGPGGRLRRVVSLSDLAGATAGSQRVSTALAAGQPVSGRKTSTKKTRTASSMSRSTSLSSFDQGAAEGGRGSVRGGGVSTLCRPTISSANKHRSSSVSAAAGSTATRHRSTPAITTDVCDSSSDCCASPELRKSVPPAGSGQQRLAHRNSGCHTVTVTATDKPLATSDLPVDQLPLSESECSAVSSLLQLSVDRFVQFHRRLAAASTALPSTTVTASSRNHQQQQQQQLVALQLCQQLEHVATSASRTLSQVAATATSGAAGGATAAAAGGGGGGAVPNGSTDPALLHVMQQYSDALLSMVQQRIQQQQ